MITGVTAYWKSKNREMSGALVQDGNGAYEVRTDGTHSLPLADLQTSSGFYMLDGNGNQIFTL